MTDDIPLLRYTTYPHAVIYEDNKAASLFNLVWLKYNKGVRLQQEPMEYIPAVNQANMRYASADSELIH